MNRGRATPGPRPWLTVGVRNPRTTIVIALIVVGLSIAAVSRLRPDASVESMFGAQHPSAAALSRVLDRFGLAEDLLVLASFPEGSAPDAAPQRVRALRAFAARLTLNLDPDRNPDAQGLVRAVTSAPPPALAEYVAARVVPFGPFFLSDAQLDELAARLTRPAMDEQLAQDEAMLAAPSAGPLAAALVRDPLRLREFVAPRLASLAGSWSGSAGAEEFIDPGARAILIRVSGIGAPSDLAFAARFTALVEDAARRSEPGALVVELGGAYPIAALSERSVRADMTSSIAWSLGLMAALFLLMYRSPLAFPLAIAPVAIGILGAFALRSLVSPTLTPLTAVIGAMLAGLGSDYGVHLMSHVEHDRSAAEERSAPCARAVSALAGPLSIACLTSIAGFFALLYSDLPALRDFAALGCVGLWLVLIATLGVLPALLAMLPDRLAGISLVGARFSFAPVASWTWTHRRLSVFAVVAIALGAGAVVFRPGPFAWVEDDLRVMHPQPNPALQTQARIASLFGVSPGTLLVEIRAETPALLVHAAHRVAAALTSDAGGKVGVVGALGLHLLLPDPERERAVRDRLEAIDPARVERDFRDALHASPFNPEAFADYAAFLRSLLGPGPIPALAALAEYPAVAEMVLPRGNPADARASLTTVFFAHDLDRRETRAAAIEQLRALLSDIPGATLTGLPVLGHDAEDAVRRSLPRVLGIGLLIVAVLLGAYFRSAVDVGLALTPFVFGTLGAAAYMRASGTPLNMANQMALPILCGLGVDFGIFIVGLTRASRSAGAPPAETVRSLGTSLHAIFMSTAPNILAVGSLTATSVPAIQSLGTILGIGLAGAWLSAQFLVAPLAIARASRSPAARPNLR